MSDVSTVCCALCYRIAAKMNVENTLNRIFSGYMTCCKNSFITFIKLSISSERYRAKERVCVGIVHSMRHFFGEQFFFSSLY